MRRAAVRVVIAGLLLWLPVVSAAPLVAQREVDIAVRYISSAAVYLDAGRAAGLAIGARLRVLRGGAEVAEIEVDYVAENSASCRVVRAISAIQAGDRVVVLSTPAPEEEPARSTPAPPPAPTPVPYAYQPPSPARSSVRASGSIALSLRNLTVDAGPSSEETSGRLSLRLRDIGGLPLALRVRARSRQVRRDGYGSAAARSQNSDRLYELSLDYAPPEGRVHLELGRLAGGHYASLGYVDGALAEFRIGGGLWIGALGGSRPELGNLGFETGGQKYGAFLRWANRAEFDRPYAEILLGAASERDDAGDASRDFVTVESRFGSGARWWISQRAEVDFHRDWRKEVAGSSSQVTNAALAGSFRLTDGLRATLSYDQRRNLLTAETRPRPEEVFTRYLREGARLGLDWRSQGGWSAALGYGTQRADTLAQDTSSISFSLADNRSFGQPLMLGIDGSVYDGQAADGWVASLRSRWSFRGGHDIGLTLGASQARVGTEFDLTPRDNQWLRLAGNLQLPASLWLYGEYEVATGDDFEGNRAVLEVGYRF